MTGGAGTAQAATLWEVARGTGVQLTDPTERSFWCPRLRSACDQAAISCETGMFVGR